MTRFSPLVLLVVLAAGLRAQDGQAAINTICPVMTKKEVTADDFVVSHRGIDVLLCCKKCVKRFTANPEKYLPRLPQFEALLLADAAAAEETIPSDDELDEVAEEPGALERIARLHPLVVHFPIAFLLLAGVLEILALIGRRPAAASGVRLLVFVGALGAIVSTALGWFLADASLADGADAALVEDHRWLGCTTTVLAVIASLASLGNPVGWRALVFRLAILAAAITVAGSGHLGGLLVHGIDYF